MSGVPPKSPISWPSVERFGRPTGRRLKNSRATKLPIRIEDARPTNTPFTILRQASSSVGRVPSSSCRCSRRAKLVGAINIYRQEVRPFTDKQVDLVANFAAQAVIAIENARLLSELRKSLEQQTATSEVLQVISSSPGELTPVFDSMLANATHICEASLGVLLLAEGDAFRTAAVQGSLPAAFMDKWRSGALVRRDPDLPAHRAAVTRQPVQIADLRTIPAYRAGHPLTVSGADDAGIRTMVTVPMIKDNEAVGVIAIYRQEIRPFTDKQIALVTNFAGQAVIAIENARLLSELRETLERQTATSEVLQVISRSPGELQPVFDTMLAKASELCEASYGLLWLSEGDAFRTAAQHGDLPPAYVDLWRNGTLFRPGPDVLLSRVAISGKPIQVADLRTDASYLSGDPLPVAAADIAGIRTLLAVPMVRDKQVVGAIGIYRKEIRPFSEKQVELVTNFAAQAVIAIENARLLSELRETLERQTATSEVLKVISSSPGELEPVFQAMLENATRICEANFGTLLLCEGDALRAVALHGGEKAYADERRRNPVFRPSPNVPVARAVRTKQVEHVTDLRTEQAYIERDKAIVTMVEAAGARTFLAVPMLKDEKAVGAVIIYRQEVRPFSNKQIELVQNFAAQAVIAIENTRLLNELRESLEQQTATSEVLSVISPVRRASCSRCSTRCWRMLSAFARRNSGPCIASKANHSTRRRC